MIRISSIVIYSLIISASTTYSQSSGIGWGIKGGLNMSGVQTDNILLVQNNSKLGWQAGVFSKSVVEGWGYLAEASIITMGSKQVVGDESQKILSVIYLHHSPFSTSQIQIGLSYWEAMLLSGSGPGVNHQKQG